MARYGQRFKKRAVAREVGIGAGTLSRWRDTIQSRVTPARGWTADARLDAVITTAAMDELGKGRWYCEHGVFRTELDTRARDHHPARWSGPTRDWAPTGAVTLNPERDAAVTAHVTADKQILAA